MSRSIALCVLCLCSSSIRAEDLRLAEFTWSSAFFWQFVDDNDLQFETTILTKDGAHVWMQRVERTTYFQDSFECWVDFIEDFDSPWWGPNATWKMRSEAVHFSNFYKLNDPSPNNPEYYRVAHQNVMSSEEEHDTLSKYNAAVFDDFYPSDW